MLSDLWHALSAHWPNICVILAAVSCAPNREVKYAEEEACMLNADLAMETRARLLCKGYEWAACPERDSVIAKHREELEACRQP